MSKIRQSDQSDVFPLSHPIIRREMRNECLACGGSLGVSMNQGLHIHLCRKCRDKVVRNMREFIGMEKENKYVRLSTGFFK